MPAFAPVPIRTRAGWTAARQGMFIEALAATGSVAMATKAAGMGHCGVYKVRHMAGAESFARAWDEAVVLAARRVRDVLIDHSIHGVPERVLIGKTKVVERRRFNHRTMIWVLQHHMPDVYPGGSTTHRRGWEGAGRKPRPHEKPAKSDDEVMGEIMRKLDAVRRRTLRELAEDPARRAAYELLHGPQDWEAALGPPAARGEAAS